MQRNFGTMVVVGSVVVGLFVAQATAGGPDWCGSGYHRLFGPHSLHSPQRSLMTRLWFALALSPWLASAHAQSASPSPGFTYADPMANSSAVLIDGASGSAGLPSFATSSVAVIAASSSYRGVVRAEAEDLMSGDRRLVGEAEYVMVALDEGGQPSPARPLSQD